MPFAKVYGLPNSASAGTLINLRRAIVSTLSEVMKSPKEWVRPFFVRDMLDEYPPVDESDGSQTIYCNLDTAMFHGMDPITATVNAKKATDALAHVVWDAFDGKYEVEVFVGNFNPLWKALCKAILHARKK